MPNHVCWLCKSKTGHTLNGDPSILGPESGRASTACAPFICGSCQGQSIAMALMFDQPSLRRFFENARGDELVWRPSATESQNYPDVPQHIGDAATEAYECHASQHYRGSIMLARAVIEATAKNKGIIDGNLYQKIEEMATLGLIRAAIKDAAHGVRELGNGMAHGDFVDPITEEESALVIRLMGEILNEVYQSPAAIAKANQAVQARRGAASDGGSSRS